MRTGLEQVLRDPPAVLRDARAFGLLCNQASVTADFVHAADALHAKFPRALRAYFGPQHGLWSTEQDDMLETGHATYRGLPAYSLYERTRRPTAAMLEGLDLLVVDLQDVGVRVYTYVWTMLLCMEACAEHGIPVLVLDRPNPLGGALAEGALLDPEFSSFVGMAPIPMRHGLTLGELARHFVRALGVDCALHVASVEGWDRAHTWAETGRAWVPPSPNLPRFEGLRSYPGQVLLEATNLSEGRGTTTPFEQFGAPWLEPERLADALFAHGAPGVALRPVQFEPTFHKHAERRCRGLFVHVTDAQTFRPYRFGLLLLRELRRLWPDELRWKQPPFEYEESLAPIDVLTGSGDARAFVDDLGADDELERIAAAPAGWWTGVGPSLLYG